MMRGETLKIKVFHMEEVTTGNDFRIEPTRLQIKQDFDCEDATIQKLTIRLLPPHQHEGVGCVGYRDHAYTYGSFSRHDWGY